MWLVLRHFPLHPKNENKPRKAMELSTKFNIHFRFVPFSAKFQFTFIHFFLIMFRMKWSQNYKLFNQYSNSQQSAQLVKSSLPPSTNIVKLFFSQKPNDKEKVKQVPSDGKVPDVIYLQSPWMWLQNKIYFSFLRWSWDPIFSEVDFKRGSKQVSVIS